MSEYLFSIKSRTAYQSERSDIFGSTTSLEWYIRRHRRRLNQAGALLVVSGRLMVDEKSFDNAVLEIGRELAGEVAA